ncbi:hypothetical protein SAVIM40S_00738 [Streptomyces avidinii]
MSATRVTCALAMTNWEKAVDSEVTVPRLVAVMAWTATAVPRSRRPLQTSHSPAASTSRGPKTWNTACPLEAAPCRTIRRRVRSIAPA